MILGIDPKNDFAFKYMLSKEKRTSLLIYVLNAVLNLPLGSRITWVEILNPITEQELLGDKLSVLDLRVRDQQGRQYIVEMQMAIHPAFAERLVFYTTKKYGSQLQSGDEYIELRSVICICFLDGRLFRNTDRWHLHFKLQDSETQIVLSDQLQIHLFQLPNFTKTADQIENEMEMWLYFFNNGSELDTENLPPALQTPPIQEAVEVLQMLTQDERERELYYDREKARRDALWIERSRERAEKEIQESRERAEKEVQESRERAEKEVQESRERAEKEVQESRERAEKEIQEKLQQLQEQEAQLKQREEELQRQATAAEQRAAEAAAAEQRAAEAAAGFIGQIHLCQRLLKQTPTPEAELKAFSLEELRQRAEQLQQQLLNHA